MMIPKTIPNWYNDTREPLFEAGDISDIYSGDSMEAAPTPTPPIIRARTKKVKFDANKHPIAEMANKKAVITSAFFRPILSATYPAVKAPRIQPRIALDTAHPFNEGVSENFVSINPMAPEITAVSYPNKKPPNAPMAVILNK
jgi:hypothetical protein